MIALLRSYSAFPKPVVFTINHRFLLSAWLAVILLGSSFTGLARGKQLRIDSLLQQLPNASDSLKIKLYIGLYSTTSESDPRASVAYIKKAIALAEATNDSLELAGTYMNYAIACYYTHELEEALSAFDKAIVLFEVMNHQQGLSMAVGNMANILQQQARWQEALSYQRKSLRISQQIDDVEGVAASMKSMGSSFRALGKPDSSLKYFARSLNLYVELEMREEQIIVLSSIGHEYSRYGLYEQAEVCLREVLDYLVQIDAKGKIGLVNRFLGTNALMQEKWEEAAQYFGASQVFYEKVENKPGIANAMHGFGLILLKQNKAQEALVKLQKALHFSSKEINPEERAKFTISIGKAFLVLNQMDSAMHYLHQGMGLAADGPFVYQIQHASDALATAYRQLGQEDQALKYETEHLHISDSVFVQSGFATLEKLRADYYTDRSRNLSTETLLQQQKLELEREKSQQQKLIIGLLVVLFLLVVVVAFWLVARNKVRLRARVLVEREKGLWAMMDADHQVREKVSRELHDGIGQTLTGLRFKLLSLSRKSAGENKDDKLQELSREMDEAIEEVRSISHLMMPSSVNDYGLVSALEELLERTAKTHSFTYAFKQNVEVGKRFSETVEMNVYRICQELLNNTLKHAQADEVRLCISAGHRLQLVFEDNGTGFDYRAALHKGSGLRNINSRAEILGGTVNMEAVQSRGQRTVLMIPLKP